MKLDKQNLIKNEEAKKVAFQEYVKSTKDCYKERKKKFIIIGLIVFIIVSIIKTFFGTIEIYNIFGYQSSNARYYRVTVNEKQVAVSYTLRRKIPLIPYLVNFNSTYLGNSNINNDDTGPFFYADNSTKYLINISSYKCYYNNTQIECTSNTQTMKETNDEKYSKITIQRISNPREVTYQGKFINDITQYIKENGQYHIEITTKQNFNETKIYFYFNNFIKNNNV